ncbi:MAG TPA: hypothetical protein PKG90_15100 [Chitinophagaceae bacterium]|nr:hypothetical protein [Chitinophagaceae bacterium]HNU15505.1 hypothetical protein [Chitinophagaceae bacterium]
MSTTTTTGATAPPIKSGMGLSFILKDKDATIRIYLDYEYLPLKQITALIKNVNDLYELVYVIIHDEKVPKNDILALAKAETTNSLEWVAQLVKELKPSKKAIRALIITGLLIQSPVMIEDYKQTRADRIHTEYLIEKVKAETRKINADAEKTELENKITKMKLDEAEKRKLRQATNKKKVETKVIQIKKTIINNTVNICSVNGDVIYKKED